MALDGVPRTWGRADVTVSAWSVIGCGTVTRNRTVTRHGAFAATGFVVGSNAGIHAVIAAP